LVGHFCKYLLIKLIVALGLRNSDVVLDDM
jgi:hypothetical protein